MNSTDILSNTHFFFIGVGGAGMSAIAQYLSGIGKKVSGSDRLFLSPENDGLKKQLEAEGITCYIQDGSGISEETEVMVASTAIEADNVEIQKAKQLGIPIVHRAELLAHICESKKTIAIAGTSGKSTTTAMLFHLLTHCGIDASLITGAGLVSLIQKGKIGNAHVGKSDYLLIEADESDGSLVNYKPFMGVLLNMDKDHKSLEELDEIFKIFRSHCQEYFIVNQSNVAVKPYSVHSPFDFGEGTPYQGTDFRQNGFQISFEIGDCMCTIPIIGRHNMENAEACLAVAAALNVPIREACLSFKNYPGIYRRHQLLGVKGCMTVIDDYAHNPAKIAASIKSAQAVAGKVLAWFQPHGYIPTKFIREELIDEISKTLRPHDEMWMSEIYYAGGTTTRDISANDLIEDLKQKGTQAYFVPDRKDLLKEMRSHLADDCAILLMGARDPGLEKFAAEFYENL